MIGGVTRRVLPHLFGVPHLYVNRPLMLLSERKLGNYFDSSSLDLGKAKGVSSRWNSLQDWIRKGAEKDNSLIARWKWKHAVKQNLRLTKTTSCFMTPSNCYYYYYFLKRPTKNVKQGFKATNEHKFFAYNL